MTKSIVIFLFLTMNLSIACQAQVIVSEKDFTSKNILSKIFNGEFKEENNAQKWPVCGLQALELNQSYVDFTQNAYTIVDTILSVQLDTNFCKIVVFKTMRVDSSGWIQDCNGCPPQIGVAYFVKNNQHFELQFFKLNLMVNGQGFYIPKSHIEKIGPFSYAFVLTEEIRQDQGREYWFHISNEFHEFLSFDYFSYIPVEPTSIIENSIEIVQTENELYDLILNSKITPTDNIDSEKAAKIKPVKTKLIYNNTDMMQHVQMPFGYSIQPK
ncbi:MAG: hypothetical protein RL207_1160 [Bacteroidota bacterium]